MPWNGRFCKVDRFAKEYSFQTPYCYAGNSPISHIDINGDYQWPSSEQDKCKRLAKYINNKHIMKLLESTDVVSTMMKYGQFESAESIKKAFTNGTGPHLEIADDIFGGAAGYYSGGKINFAYCTYSVP